MKVIVQFAGGGPVDGIAIDSSDWAQLGVVFINSLIVQGCVFDGFDRYLVEDLPGVGGCRLYGWADDPADFPVGERHGAIATFLPLAPDPEFGGAYNTVQWFEKFAEGKAWNNRRLIQKTVWKPWSDMPVMTSDQVKHGPSLSLDDLALYTAALTLRGWREWTDQLPPEEIVNGKLRSQRDAGRWKRAKGTLTYFQQSTTRASGVHAAILERALETSVGSGSNSITTIAGEGDNLGWLFTTPSLEPNNADWPNGEYRCQLDCSAGNTSVTYGLLTQGASAGHFANVDSGLTVDNESWTQDESVFSSTGLKLATNTIDPASGVVGDRFECLVSLEDARAHGGNVTTTFDCSADAFVDGPWPSLGAAIPLAAYHHYHHNLAS